MIIRIISLKTNEDYKGFHEETKLIPSVQKQCWQVNIGIRYTSCKEYSIKR
jgi:hypothetical protein